MRIVIQSSKMGKNSLCKFKNGYHLRVKIRIFADEYPKNSRHITKIYTTTKKKGYIQPISKNKQHQF
jgi:hypothetical protein